MYSIQKTTYGYYLLLEGTIDETTAAQLKSDLTARLSGKIETYSAIVDLRNLVPPRAESQGLLNETVSFAFATGMQRIAIIYNSPVVRDIIRQMAFRRGQAPVGRYIDASKTEDPVQMALDYVENGVEPPPMTQKIRIIAG
jgi:anti-anti-sigma regulatory factor